MRLKRNKDYLDSELIHYLCFGIKSENKNHQAVIFTNDSKSSLISRISIYKWVINFIKYAFEMDNPEEIIPTIKMNNGLLVICSDNFSMLDVIDVANIKPFIHSWWIQSPNINGDDWERLQVN